MNARTGLDPGIPFNEHEGYRRPVEFRVLGAVEVVEEGDGAVSLGGPKQRAVLAHLLLRANKLVPTEVLIDEVWGEEPPETVRNTLQTYASRLRKTLGDRIEGSRAGYLLRADPAEIDSHRFESLLRDARRLLPIDPKAAIAAFDDALSLWRGPAFGDLAGDSSIGAEAARLDELRLGAIEDRFEALIALGDHGRVIGELEALTSRHPLRERAWGQLMLALYRSGRQAEALGAFQRAREILADELGIDPSPELRKIHERILQQSPDLEVGGSPLRGYRLLERIGAGSFGTVWRAIQPEVGRDVAVKSIHPHLANDPGFIRRFEVEAQLVARLEHPHVVPLYDFWREPGGAYLVMRFLRGGSLAETLARGPLDLERVARLLDQVAGALSAAHRQGVVHRDVKPSNILLDEEGNAYLADFGIAKDLGAPDETVPGTIRGSLLYVAPEQIRGQAVSPMTDVYALGIVVHEALAGRHPLADVPDLAVLEHQLREPLPPVGERRADLPPAIDEVIVRAVAKDPELRFPDTLSMVAAFRDAVAPAMAPAPAPSPVRARNPYKGLRPFVEADAHDFFGREAFTERLLERMRGARRFMAVVGPSGSGKSSAVRAGLLPALRGGAIEGSDAWFVTEMVPGAHPMEELESALLRVAAQPPIGLLQLLESGPRGLLQATDHIVPDGAELVLVVDQFEEAFTLTEDEAERSLLLESIRVAAADASSRIRIVATLRADFYDRPLNYPRFGELLGVSTEVVTPLAPDELERAIVRPAEAVGFRVEPALVAQVASDVAEQPGALPLVQYALTELFDRSEEGRLTLSAYRDIGGVGGALASRAEHLYGTRHGAGQEAVRQLFLRLVTLGEGAADTRRRVPLSELSAIDVDPEAMGGALDAFGRHRLLTFDRDPASREPTVEVAHEALLRSWPRLRGWIEAGRDDVRMLRRLEEASLEWERVDREPSYLLRGSRLDQAVAWAEGTDVAVGRSERAFLKASIDRRAEETVAELARAEREHALERRSVTRLRTLVAVFAVAALVAGTLTVVALNRNASAQRAARLASARELAGAAFRALETDPELAALLALEAIDTTADDGVIPTDAELALREGMPLLEIRSLGGSRGVSLSRDVGRVAIVGDSGPTAVWELAVGQAGRRLFVMPSRFPTPSACPTRGEGRTATKGSAPPCGAVFRATLSDDGTLLATGHGDGHARVWDLATGETRLVVQDPYPHALRAFATPDDRAPFVFIGPGGSLWTLSAAGGWVVWDLATGEELFRPPGGYVDFSDDGTLAAIAAYTGVEIWDLETRELVREVPLYSSFFPSFAPGEHVVAFVTRAEVVLIDVPTGGIRELPGPGGGFTGTGGGLTGTSDLVFSSDGSRIASDTFGDIWVWNVATGASTALARGLGAPTALEWAPDGRALAVGEEDGSTRLFDAATGEVTVTLPDAGGPIIALAFTGDGSRLVVASADGVVRLHVIDLEDQIELVQQRLARKLTDEECRRYPQVSSCQGD